MEGKEARTWEHLVPLSSSVVGALLSLMNNNRVLLVCRPPPDRLIHEVILHRTLQCSRRTLRHLMIEVRALLKAVGFRQGHFCVEEDRFTDGDDAPLLFGAIASRPSRHLLAVRVQRLGRHPFRWTSQRCYSVYQSLKWASVLRALLRRLGLDATWVIRSR